MIASDFTSAFCAPLVGKDVTDPGSLPTRRRRERSLAGKPQCVQSNGVLSLAEPTREAVSKVEAVAGIRWWRLGPCERGYRLEVGQIADSNRALPPGDAKPASEPSRVAADSLPIPFHLRPDPRRYLRVPHLPPPTVGRFSASSPPLLTFATMFLTARPGRPSLPSSLEIRSAATPFRSAAPAMRARSESGDLNTLYSPALATPLLRAPFALFFISRSTFFLGLFFIFASTVVRGYT